MPLIEFVDMECPICKKAKVNAIDKRFVTCEDPMCPFVEKFDEEKHIIKETRDGLDS